MGIRTQATAGSMPEEVAARGTFAFDEKFLAEAQLSGFQREVGRRLLGIADTLPHGSFRARAAIEQFARPGGSPLLVNLVPRRDACAKMTIYVGREKTVHIGARSETTFGLPDDVWDERAKDVLCFMEKIVESVADGNLRETIHYRGDAVVRSESELDVDGVPVSVDRVHVGAALWRIFRKPWKREVAYAPYE